MSVGFSPPQTPPQLSPDGRWVWDGHQWQPVPVVVGDVAGIVPLVTAAAAPAPAVVVIPYSPPHVQAPAMPYMVPAAEESAVPLWEEPARTGGVSLYLFGAAALVVLIMAMMALSTLNIVRLPWQSDGSTAARATSTPLPPLATRSESARADRFLNSTLAPALVAVNQTVPSLAQTCNGTLSNACQDSITATDQQMKKLLAVIDRADIPPCIAGGVTKLRIDLSGMESGLVLALSGFKDNKPNLLAAGLNRFTSLSQAIPADAKSLDQAQKTQCNTQQVGP